MVHEELLVGNHKETSNLLEALFELLLVLLEALVLLAHEVVKLVKTLLDVGQNSGLNLLELIVDGLVSLLEDLDLSQSLITVGSSLTAEALVEVNPVLDVDTLSDVVIKLIEMLLEKVSLLLVDQVHDVVVVTNDQHDVLSVNSESVMFGRKSSKLDWHVDQTLGSNLVPVFDLDKYFVESSIEIRL